MKVFIFSAFDGVPYTDEEPMRYAAIAEEFLKNGHEVIYLTASFSHLHKKYRTVVDPPLNIKIVLLPTKSYRNNLSIDRVLSHYRLSFSLSDWLDKQDKSNLPDIVIGASPPIFANYVLANYCKKNNIPFIYDIQDLWPEEFVRFLPGRGKLKFILRPYFSAAEAIVKMASGVTAVSKDYLDYYKNEIGGKPSKVFYLGNEVKKFAAVQDVKENIDSKKKIIMLGNAQTFEYVLMAARAIQDIKGLNLTVVGLKEKSAPIKKVLRKESLDRVEIIEWMEQKDMHKMMPKFDAGLIWIDSYSKIAFPNRAFSYFAAGLPVISNIINGDLEKSIKENKLGITVPTISQIELTKAIRFCLDNFDVKEHKRIQDFARLNFDRQKIYDDYYNWVMANFETTATKK